MITDLAKRFTTHTATAGQVLAAQDIRRKALELAEMIDATCPDSREKSLAITSLEETVMWAIKGLTQL